MATKPVLAGAVPRFVVGNEYARQRDIHLKYGGSWQNGISSSAVCPAIFVFTGDSGEQYGYKDGFDAAGVFSYSGEGQIGDMKFVGGNRSLRDHAKDGRAVHLFQALGKGKPCRYMGEFSVANHSVARGPDKNGTARNIIVFHMLRVDTPEAASTDEAGPFGEGAPPSLEEARKRALEACTAGVGAAGPTAVRTLYQRSKAIRDYVLLRAQGHCIGCDLPAPFLGVDGKPYLEAHHTLRLSDGGMDHPRYVAAICPTCHRRIHYGQDGPSLNKRLVNWLERHEPLK